MKIYKYQGNCIHIENKYDKVLYMVYWKETVIRESFLVCAKCYNKDYYNQKGLQGAVKLIQKNNRVDIQIIKDGHIYGQRYL